MFKTKMTNYVMQYICNICDIKVSITGFFYIYTAKSRLPKKIKLCQICVMHYIGFDFICQLHPLEQDVEVCDCTVCTSIVNVGNDECAKFYCMDKNLVSPITFERLSINKYGAFCSPCWNSFAYSFKKFNLDVQI